MYRSGEPLTAGSVVELVKIIVKTGKLVSLWKLLEAKRADFNDQRLMKTLSFAGVSTDVRSKRQRESESKIPDASVPHGDPFTRTINKD